VPHSWVACAGVVPIGDVGIYRTCSHPGLSNPMTPAMPLKVMTSGGFQNFSPAAAGEDQRLNHSVPTGPRVTVEVTRLFWMCWNWNVPSSRRWRRSSVASPVKSMMPARDLWDRPPARCASGEIKDQSVDLVFVPRWGLAAPSSHPPPAASAAAAAAPRLLLG
jgi:hypothetical protein